MADSPRHVVLAKPGDVLLLSNVGTCTREQAQELSRFFAALDIHIVISAADLDIARVDLGPDDCGCGGCDSCAQHALLRQLQTRGEGPSPVGNDPSSH